MRFQQALRRLLECARHPKMSARGVLRSRIDRGSCDGESSPVWALDQELARIVLMSKRLWLLWYCERILTSLSSLIA